MTDAEGFGWICPICDIKARWAHGLYRHCEHHGLYRASKGYVVSTYYDNRPPEEKTHDTTYATLQRNPDVSFWNRPKSKPLTLMESMERYVASLP